MIDIELVGAKNYHHIKYGVYEKGKKYTVENSVAMDLMREVDANGGPYFARYRGDSFIDETGFNDADLEAVQEEDSGEIDTAMEVKPPRKKRGIQIKRKEPEPDSESTPEPDSDSEVIEI